MRSFRDSIAGPPRSLCTLRADVTADYATLASGWWLALTGSPVPVTGFIQLISLSFDTSFNYGLFTARRDVPPLPPNHAERALRGSVLARKIAFGSRSDAGAHAFAVLVSILGTARRQNQPAIPFLYALFTADIAVAQAALYANSA